MIKKARNLLRNCDQHGAPISLSYKGKTTYQTAIGGGLTILSRLGIMAYFLVIVSLVFNRDKAVTNRLVAKSATRDFQQYHITLDHFDIAYGLYFKNSLSYSDVKNNTWKYFNIQIQSIQNLYLQSEDGKVSRKQFVTNIPWTSCSLTRFANLSEEIKNYGINQVGWYCPEDINVNVTGQPQSLNQTRIRFLISLCQNSSANNNSCATLDSIRAVTNNLFFQVGTLNTYFNEDNFDSEPIKRSINVETYPVVLNQTYFSLRTLRRNHITTKDNWLSSSFGNNEYVFYQDQMGLQKVGADYNQLLILTFSCDGQESYITRKVLTISDAGSIAGGFASIIILFTKIISKLYANPLFYQSIFKRIIEFQKTGKQVVWREFKQSSIENQLAIVNSLIRNKRTLKINALKGICINFFSAFCKKPSHGNHPTFYQQGLHIYQSHIDIVKLLKTVNKLKIFERIILKDYQRSILKFKSKYLIPQHEEQPLRKQKLKRSSTITEGTDMSIKRMLHNRKSLINNNLIKELLQIQHKNEEKNFTTEKSPRKSLSIFPQINKSLKESSAVLQLKDVDDVEMFNNSKRDLISPSFTRKSNSKMSKDFNNGTYRDKTFRSSFKQTNKKK